MNIALVGCGMISDDHVQEIQKIPDTKIVGVCDSELLMAEQLADRYDIPKYHANLNEMLGNSHVDVVHIITPPATHLPLTLTALEAGCHVLVEKPFTINVDEAVQAIDKARSTDRKITVNHFHNFSPPAIRLRKIILDGLVGDIIHIESFYGYSLRSPAALTLTKEPTSWLYGLPGGLLQNNISHLLAKITRFMLDENPKVLAHANRFSDTVKNIGHSCLLDELRVLIAGEKISAYATFSANVNPYQHFMIVYGSKGTVSVDYESRTIVYKHSSKVPGSPGKLLPPFHYAKQYLLGGARNLVEFAKSRFHYYSGMNTLLRLFYNCIQNDTKVPIPYVEIIKLHKIMDEIFKQINQKQPIN